MYYNIFNKCLRSQLAIAIGFTSGGWPYVKLVTMLACFVLPPQAISVQRRETLLRIFDVLGKWSFIDAYVSVLFGSAFNFGIFLANLVSVVVTVQPKWSFYLYFVCIVNGLGSYFEFNVLACSYFSYYL